MIISGLFLGTSAVVIMAPGPDTALVTYLVLSSRRSMPAACAAAGMLTSGAGYAGLALSGMALVFRAEPAALTTVRWCGALVLGAWGVRGLCHAARPRGRAARAPEAGRPEAGPPGVRKPGRWYLMGLACTGGNPKVSLFLLAYLPQFVPPHAPVGSSMAELAAVYLSLGGLWLAFVIGVVRLVQNRLAVRRAGGTSHPADRGRNGNRQAGASRFRRWSEGVLGLVFIAFAIRLGLG
jgi:threonine/homoserine/homoserine lactone efflux protein